MRDLTGQDVGRYHIVERLGEGGMAVVYKAYDLRLKREVAIKFIRTETIPPNQLEKMLARFEREALALAQLEHANIIRIFDYGEHEGEPYLVMNYVPGGTLKQYIGRPLACKDAARLVLPVARALEYAHEQGVVHRDVKPANILITRRGEPMLSDFGIARLLESEGGTITGTGVGIGTPEYMAPEQWNGKATPASDIYALGTVLFELMTGQVPFQADTPIAILVKVMKDPLPRPGDLAAGLPTEAEQVLFKALAKEPGERYTTMGEMIGDLEKLLQVDGSATPVLLLPAAEPETRDFKGDNFQTEVVTVPAPEPAPLKQERPPLEERLAQVKEPATVPEPPEKPVLPAAPPPKAGTDKTWLLGGAAALGGLLLICVILFGLGAGGMGPLAELFGGPKSTEPAAVAAAQEIPTWTASPTAAKTAAPTRLPTRTTTARRAATPKAGDERVWKKDGMTQVYVPAGNFQMGSKGGEADEKPVHTVVLDAFWLDKTEVTNAMFARFADGTGYQTDAEKGGTGWIWTGSEWKEVNGADWAHPQGPTSNMGGKDHWPVVLVSWNDAAAYCAWAGKRLPTEAEWEKAARGTDERAYPWGNEAPSCDLANYRNGDNSWCVKDTTEVGSYPAGVSPYGALDMAGNVWEWVADWYGDYPSEALRNPAGPESGQNRVLRGGGWDYGENGIRAAYRYDLDPTIHSNLIGFRCVSPSP